MRDFTGDLKRFKEWGMAFWHNPTPGLLRAMKTSMITKILIMSLFLPPTAQAFSAFIQKKQDEIIQIMDAGWFKQLSPDQQHARLAPHITDWLRAMRNETMQNIMDGHYQTAKTDVLNLKHIATELKQDRLIFDCKALQADIDSLENLQTEQDLAKNAAAYKQIKKENGIQTVQGRQHIVWTHTSKDIQFAADIARAHIEKFAQDHHLQLQGQPRMHLDLETGTATLWWEVR
ncbi:MAG: hypothetical protein V1725_04760 [archaeon]